MAHLAPAVRVTAARTCGEGPSDGFAAQLWNDARTALTAAVLTSSRHDIRVTIEHDLRVLEPRQLTVVRSRRWADSGTTVEPFVSVSPADLAQRGYVITQPNGRLVYRAPDATVLTSDAFAEQHCFTVVEPGDPEGREFADQTQADTANVIGLAFEPTPERQLPDIRGVMWLDATTHYLRYVRFNYATLDKVDGHNAVGGYVQFARLPSGAWIVQRWWLRLPELSEIGVQRDLPGFGSPRLERRIRIDTIRESGAEVTAVAGAPLTLRSTQLGAVIGQVRDTVTGEPVANAEVRMRGSGLYATSGSDGSFLIDSVLPGRYAVEVAIPPWDTLGVPLPARTVQVSAGAAIRTDLWVPTLAAIEHELCPDMPLNPHESSDSTKLGTGILRGTLRTDAGTGVGNAPITVSWVDFERTLGGLHLGGTEIHASGRTDSAGAFLLCGIRVNHPLGLVMRDPRDNRRVIFQDSMRLPPTGFGTRQIVVPTIAEGSVGVTGAIRGVVRSSDAAHPIDGVEVSVEPGHLATRSNDSGRYVLGPLDAGEYQLIVRKPGFEPRAAHVTLAVGDSLVVNLTLNELPVQLGAVHARAQGAPLSDFERRRKSGSGVYVSRGTLNAKAGFQLSNLLLAEAPRLELVRYGDNRVALANRTTPFIPCGTLAPCDHPRPWPDKCYVQVFVDGIQVYSYNTGNTMEPFDINSMAPADLMGVEVYVGASDTPAELNGSGSACGTVVLWTRSAAISPADTSGGW